MAKHLTPAEIAEFQDEARGMKPEAQRDLLNLIQKSEQAGEMHGLSQHFTPEALAWSLKGR